MFVYANLEPFTIYYIICIIFIEVHREKHNIILYINLFILYSFSLEYFFSFLPLYIIIIAQKNCRNNI